MYQEVGVYQEVGEFHNYSFKILNLEKIKTQRICFTPSYVHEREFWISQFDSIPLLCDYIRNTDNCWREIIKEAKKYKNKIMSKKYLPAIKQAIEVMLK